MKRKTIHLNFFWMCKIINLFNNCYFFCINFFIIFLSFFGFFPNYFKRWFFRFLIQYSRTYSTYVIIFRGGAAEGTDVPRCTTGTTQAVRIRGTQENWTHPPASGKTACWRPGTGNQFLRPLLVGHYLYFLSFLSLLFL